MIKKGVLVYIIVGLFGCSTPKEEFTSQITRSDSILVIKTSTIDIVYLSDFKGLNFLWAVSDKRILKNGDKYRSKMFFMGDSLFHPPYGTGKKDYKMFYKLGSLDDTTIHYQEITPIQDTAYVQFVINENVKDSLDREWSGKIVIKLPNRDTTFFLQEQYRIKR